MIQLFCPSRGRPLAAGELLATFLATKTLPGTRLIFCVDHDDTTLEEYPWSNVLFGTPTGDPTGPLNRAALDVSEETDIVGFIGDDSRCETRGWDQQVTDALREPGFCWGYDGTSSKPWPSTIFVSKAIVDALGYLALPTLRRGYFDVQWLYLASATKTGHPIPAMFRHDNSAGDPKSPNFKPEAQVPPAIIEADRLNYEDWVEHRSAEDVKKVRSVELARFFA